MPRRLFLITITTICCIAGPPAQAASAFSISASQGERGWIALSVSDLPGSAVHITELRDGVALPVADARVPANGLLEIPRASAWNCNPGARQFNVTGSAGQIASTTVTTPSCAGRLTVKASPRQMRAGQRVTVRVTDRWGVGGVTARFCVAAPAATESDCNNLKLASGKTVGKQTFRTKRPGRYGVAVKLAMKTTRRYVEARPRSGRLRVLATGDSMIQVLDGFLKQRLRRIEPIKFRGDAHISTGISKPFTLNWPRRAASIARSFRPDVTVVFLGANDGFNMPVKGHSLATCCGESWVNEYARRAGRMMRSYERGGAGSVYWLLLPTPRSREFAKIYRQVNAAVKQAAAKSRSTQVVDLAKVFTPGGHFRGSMTWHGHPLIVRAPDGVHLSVSGARVASHVIASRLRRDHVVER